RARDLTNRRYRFGGRVDEAIKAKNRTKSKVRSKVEHAIGVIKRVFGFQKVRYRGLAKNLHRLEASAALANLFMMRRRLLTLRGRCAGNPENRGAKYEPSAQPRRSESFGRLPSAFFNTDSHSRLHFQRFFRPSLARLVHADCRPNVTASWNTVQLLGVPQEGKGQADLLRR